MKKYLLFLFVSLLLVTSQISAFFPNTHYQTVLEALKKPSDSPLYKACNENKGYCLAGDMLSDVSVFWYYTKFIRYKVTHNPPLCKNLIKNAPPELMACAVGACIHQQGADIVSHNTMVPKTITITKLPNVIVHPFAEQKLDVWIEKKYPQTDFENLVKVSDFQACKQMFIDAMASDNAYLNEELDGKFNSFILELTREGDTGYDASFQSIFIIPTPAVITYFGIMFLFVIVLVFLWLKKLRYKDRRTMLNYITFGVLLILTLFMGFLAYQFTQGKAFDTFSKYVARPISAITPLGADEGAYFQDAVQKTELFFQQGVIALENTDASGQAALNAADASIKNIQYIIMFILGVLIVGILYLNFKEVRPKGMTLGGL